MRALLEREPTLDAARVGWRERMRGLLAEGQFPPGSMGPKVEAAIAFAEHSGGTAVITSPAHLADALAPDASVGTRVVAMAPAPSQGRGNA